MLLPAECPSCGHAYQIDSGYIGVKRKCPECESLFVFEGADGGANVLPLRLACPICLRDFTVKDVFEASERIPCSVCGHIMTRAEGQETLVLAEQATEACRQALLDGASGNEVARQLVQMGIDVDAAATQVDNEMMRLPFLRHEIYVQNGDGKPRPPVECDLCGMELQETMKKECHIVRWHCRYTPKEEIDSGPFPIFFHSGAYIMARVISGMVAGMFSSAMGISPNLDNVLDAVYFLCPRCDHSLRTKLFGRYKGYPARNGYRIVSHEMHRV